MIPSTQALEVLSKEIEKVSHDLDTKEKELRRAEMGLVERKRHYDTEQEAVSKLKQEIEHLKSLMGQHQREFTSMQANLTKFLKK